MRSLFHFRWLLALVAALGSLRAAHASHVRGGEITYSSIASTTPGVPRYHVLVTLYMDPTNLSTLQTTLTLLATKGNCGVANAANFSVEIPRGVSRPFVSVTCTPDQDYQVFAFETDLDLSTGQWTLSTILSNRISTLQNLVNSLDKDIFLYAYLDNTLTSQDSSPKFESQTIPFMSQTAVTPLSFSTFDADADSLRYEFWLPQQVVGGAPVTYSSTTPCSQVIPATFSPHYQLNTATGALTPVPGILPTGFYNATARVSEYRRIGGQWQLLGYVVRDFTYVTYVTTNQPPTFTTLRVNSGPAQSPDLPITARAGQRLTLTLDATDPDAGQQLRFRSNAPNVVPGLTLTTLSGTQAQLAWQVPATLPPGRYALALEVLDNGCTVNSDESRTLTVLVTNEPLATRASLNAEHEAYPVPFRDQVQFQAAPNQAVTLVDALGRVVAQLVSGADGRVVWQPGAALPAGLYIARAADGQPLARLLRADN